MPDLPSTPMQDEANVHAEPLVSVIMNCYNGEQYLRDAINSVIGQTYQNWELIFWDNQSTDHSAATFMSYADPRLRYFYAPSHTVLYDARNHAVSKSRGEFLAFLDVDDWWTTDKLTAQIGLFADETVGLVYGNFWIARNGDRLKLAHHKRLPEGNVLNQLIEHYCVGLLTIVVRRSAFESLSYPFDSRYRMIGDMDLAVRLAVNWDFAAIQRPLAFYRLHGNNESIRGFGCAIKEHENWYCEATNQYWIQ